MVVRKVNMFCQGNRVLGLCCVFMVSLLLGGCEQQIVSSENAIPETMSVGDERTAQTQTDGVSVTSSESFLDSPDELRRLIDESKSDSEDATAELPDSGSDPTEVEQREVRLRQEAEKNSGEVPVQASPSNPPPKMIVHPSISNENDFEVVSERETIQSDAQRLEKIRSQYQQISPVEVPDRGDERSINIVEFAISTQNPVGSRVYKRLVGSLTDRADRYCSTYSSPDQAQFAFMERGGPKIDRLGLDPDGDGFACSWDPTPFRVAVQR